VNERVRGVSSGLLTKRFAENTIDCGQALFCLLCVPIPSYFYLDAMLILLLLEILIGKAEIPYEEVMYEREAYVRESFRTFGARRQS